MPRRFLTLLFLLSAATSCAEGPLSPGERTALREARARWARSGGPDYTVEARVGCFCMLHLNAWTRLTVRAGQLVSAVPVQPLPAGVTPSLGGWQTVEGLFARVGSPDEIVRDVAVRFDAQRGYPLYASFGCGPDVLDCGSLYEMRNLTIP